MTCPESITREDETRGCLRTGHHTCHYTGFPSEQPVRSRFRDRDGAFRWVDEHVLEVYTWCGTVSAHAAYRCENCGDECGPNDTWSDDDARAEASANGFDPDDDCAVVCDGCYERMMAWTGLTARERTWT